ncbi:BTB domain-containing protein [Plasmodiophora brassicae]
MEESSTLARGERTAPTHVSTLQADLQRILEERILTDIEIVVGEERFPAHRAILCARVPYFQQLLADRSETGGSITSWVENTTRVFSKPNTTPAAVSALLAYVYTDSLPEIGNSALLLELFQLADEMQMQALMETVWMMLADFVVESLSSTGPIARVVGTVICPCLKIAERHGATRLSRRILHATSENMDAIVRRPDAMNSLHDGASPATMLQILSNDRLNLDEVDVLDIAVNYCCRKAGLSFTDLRNSGMPSYTHGMRIHAADSDEDDNEPDLVRILTMLLGAVRFTLMDAKQFSHVMRCASSFLPRDKFHMICEFFMTSPSSLSAPFDRPRTGRILPSAIIGRGSDRLLRQWVLESWSEARTSKTSKSVLTFRIIYRGTRDGLAARSFHDKCDGKGPTVVLVRSTNGNVFGGFNANSWGSYGSSSSRHNFLFSLSNPSRKYPVAEPEYACLNDWSRGPVFGQGPDMSIADMAKVSDTSWNNARSYPGASGLAGAGCTNFDVEDYEVFAVEWTTTAAE